MSWGFLFLALTCTAVLASGIVWIYRHREIPVPGRGLLAATRIVVVALLVLLLLDVRLPASAGNAGESDWVLLDASRSMSAAGTGPTPWERGVERGRALRERGARVFLFGGSEPMVLPEGGDGSVEPELTSSRLTPALERAAESGVRSVVLLSDLRLEDAVLVRSTVDRLGLSLEVEDLGVDVRNVGIGEFRLPRAVRAGDSIHAEVTVFGSGFEATSDSVRLEVRIGEGDDGSVVAARRALLPGPGLERTVGLVLPPPADSGTVRYLVGVGGAEDAFPDDDVRVGWLTINPVEGSVVLVSTAPDWEPRFLLPVLGRVSGLPVVGYLRMDGARWLVMEGRGASRTTSDAEVRRATAAAEILVIQSAGDDPEWLPGAANASRRLLVLPSSPGALALGGLEGEGPRVGEWYVAPDLPASPLAGELGGVDLEGLPPVGPVFPLVDDGRQDHFVPLLLQRGGGGASVPGLVLLQGDEGRRALTLASGYWRWAFRSGSGRAVYERLWSGVTGWLLAERAAGATARIRPVTPVVERGTPVRWIAQGAAGDSLTLRLSSADSVVHDTTLAVPPDGTFTTPELPPGSYFYEGESGAARAAGGAAGDSEPGASDLPTSDVGRLDVEAWSGELRPLRATDLGGGGREGGIAESTPVFGRPLRTHPVPYLLVLTLLCVEWVARRRKGLR